MTSICVNIILNYYQEIIKSLRCIIVINAARALRKHNQHKKQFSLAKLWELTLLSAKSALIYTTCKIGSNICQHFMGHGLIFKVLSIGIYLWLIPAQVMNEYAIPYFSYKIIKASGSWDSRLIITACLALLILYSFYKKHLNKWNKKDIQAIFLLKKSSL